MLSGWWQYCSHDLLPMIDAAYKLEKEYDSSTVLLTCQEKH